MPEKVVHTDVSPAAAVVNTTAVKEAWQEQPVKEAPQNLMAVQCELKVGAPDDPLEHEADAMAEKVMRMPEQSFLQRKCTDCEKEETLHRKPLGAGITPFLQAKSQKNTSSVSTDTAASIQSSRGNGQNMDAETQSFMSSRFGVDFGNVKIHSNSNSARLNDELNAKAFTVGKDIYFNEGAYRPGSTSGKTLLAHELTHVVQQNKGVGHGRVQRQALPTDLSGYPDADKRRIQISWTSVNATGTLPALNDQFGTLPATAGGTAVTRNRPSGTLVFNGAVPATPSTPQTAPAPGSPSMIYGYDVRHGLSNLAHFLEGGNILPLNSTITLTLNLTPYGGANANYRFTYFEHATGTGAAATMQEITLIEQLGAAVAIPTVANPTNAATAGNFTFGGQTFTLGSGWTLQQKAILDQALGLVPANGITQLAGVSFEIGSRSTTEEGHYSEETHTITIRSTAFNDRLNAYQSGGDAVRIILHEIAHAIDRRSVRQAWNTYNAGGQTATGRTTLERTRSLSGSSYVFDTAQNSHVLTEGAATTAFRTAVVADRTLAGVTLPGGITTYSTTNWEENFAEAFSMYMANRSLFQQLRPSTYQYFATNYP